MIVAQITDLHIRRKGKLLHHMVNTARCLRRTVKRLNALRPRPDVVIATGDLTDGGKPKEYKRLRKILAPLEIPLYVIPGNHDARGAFREAFDDHAYLPDGPYLHYVIDRYPLRLIGLDTVHAGASAGMLDEERLHWLDLTLAQRPSQPTLVFMHHPPFRTGIRYVDGSGLRGADELGEIVRRHPQIVRIVSGHIHREMHVEWNGTVAFSAPSTAHQLILELRDRQPLGFAVEPPGFALHVWDERRGSRSAVYPVDALGDSFSLPLAALLSGAS